MPDGFFVDFFVWIGWTLLSLVRLLRGLDALGVEDEDRRIIVTTKPHSLKVMVMGPKRKSCRAGPHVNGPRPSSLTTYVTIRVPTVTVSSS